jgi:transcriptional regulator with PAS, ATPase and Fis domain
LHDRLDRNSRIVGQAPAIVRLREQIGRVASSGLSVLLLGETGVGKQLVAREIHRIREEFLERNGLLHVIDCANLSDAEALERPFRLAACGTVFLDGIHELSRPLQAKLLRILEDRATIPVDVRIVAAARADASMLLDDGLLRADLYYRMCECPIEIPPLRARGSDVRLLANHFLSQLGTSAQLTESAYQALERCAWPGNVRELESVIRRAALLYAEQSTLGPECLFENPPGGRRPDINLERLLDGSWEQAKEEFARWYWTNVWRALQGDRRRIAEHARVSDVWLRSRRKLYELHDCGLDG